MIKTNKMILLYFSVGMLFLSIAAYVIIMSYEQFIDMKEKVAYKKYKVKYYKNKIQKKPQ